MESIDFNSGVKIMYYPNLLKYINSGFEDKLSLPLIWIKEPYNIILPSKKWSGKNDVLNFFKINKHDEVY